MSPTPMCRVIDGRSLRPPPVLDLLIDIFDASPRARFNGNFLAREALFLLQNYRPGRVGELDDIAAVVRVEQKPKPAFGSTNWNTIQRSVREKVRATEWVQETAPPPPPEVTVASPTVQDVTNYKYFTGYTEAQKEIDLRARVEGYLDSFSFKPGSLVKKGDLLFTIDPKPFTADVAKAQAELDTRHAERKLADATLKRKESAYKQKAVSELAVLEARAEVSKAKAQMKESKATLITAQLQLSYTKVYAPEDGRISRNLVDVGNLVGAGGDKTLLATLVNYDPIYVYFNMDERSLLAFKKSFRKTQTQKNLKKSTRPPYSGLSSGLSSPKSMIRKRTGP